MGDVIEGGFITTQKVDPDKVVNSAGEWGLDSVVIVGFRNDGGFYFASSEPNTGDVLYLFERGKWELMKMEDRIREEGDPRGKPRRGS